MRATIGLAAGGEAGTSHSQLVLLHGWWLVRAVWRLVVPKKSWWGASGGGARAEPERGGSLFLRRPPPKKKSVDNYRQPKPVKSLLEFSPMHLIHK